ncbi:hypothetical protein AJ80_03504 [Polytolypa hystricis UAMH7299]|uniref:CCHC-type domain-containing protein n=1 Tax=Polytolypa hystricis (strain UAMH7299) TaxID=1447883 RepID=A0A2B7Y9K2_POLH7|nr:hypothetical protein AJ80_03504 [Polytolypa hystricis UAMH7299]
MGGAVDHAACDSRTASVGFPQGRNKKAFNNNGGPLTTSSLEKSARKRPRKKRKQDRSSIQGFAPKGTTFTESSSLLVDSGSDSSQNTEDSGKAVVEGQEASSKPQSPTRGIQPAVNWNKTGKGAIRTSLRGTSQASNVNAATSATFNAINGKYWRSRSASVSSAEDNEQAIGKLNQNNETNGMDKTGDVPGMVLSGNTQYTTNFSDDSESGEVSEGDDDIVLNLSSQAKRAEPPVIEIQDDEDPAQLPPQGQRMLSKENRTAHRDMNGSQNAGNTVADAICIDDDSPSCWTEGPKGAAMQSFRSKYPTDPLTLGDLSSKDLDIQVKYIFYNMATKDLDLSLPIRCTECMKEGHFADICPTKECEHCGAWDIHESRFCPSWRRCQRCRERGHDTQSCPSPLKGSSLEVPCDLCGSTEHMEGDCDLIWKTPRRIPATGQIFISISCCHCASNKHLIGDCPSRRFPMNSSSWTLKAHETSMISNLSFLPIGGAAKRLRNGDTTNYRIKGRAAGRSPSPDSDDAFSRPSGWTPLNRPPPRGNIRFSSDIGRDFSNADNGSSHPQGPNNQRYPPQDHRRQYRDRDQSYSNNNRQRSRSPGPHSRQGRGGIPRYDRPTSPPRSPPRSRGPPPSNYRGRGRGRGGGGFGGRPREINQSNRDNYRPNTKRW